MKLEEGTIRLVRELGEAYSNKFKRRRSYLHVASETRLNQWDEYSVLAAIRTRSGGDEHQHCSAIASTDETAIVLLLETLITYISPLISPAGDPEAIRLVEEAKIHLKTHYGK